MNSPERDLNVEEKKLRKNIFSEKSYGPISSIANPKIDLHHPNLSVFFPGSRPGRGGRIPRADSTGGAGLLVGYGRCGCPGPGVGCAERVSGVPWVYEYSR